MRSGCRRTARHVFVGHPAPRRKWRCCMLPFTCILNLSLISTLYLVQRGGKFMHHVYVLTCMGSFTTTRIVTLYLKRDEIQQAKAHTSFCVSFCIYAYGYFPIHVSVLNVSIGSGDKLTHLAGWHDNSFRIMPAVCSVLLNVPVEWIQLLRAHTRAD